MVHDFLLLKKLNLIAVSGKNAAEERRQLFNEFVMGNTPLAICTDVWCRGIDIPSVKIVVNFEIPRHSVSTGIDKKTFVYRNGRASRFGNKIFLHLFCQ